MRLPGVTAVDVGAGDTSDDPVLRVHVADRRAVRDVAAALPRVVGGFAVQVIQARYGLQDARDTRPGP